MFPRSSQQDARNARLANTEGIGNGTQWSRSANPAYFQNILFCEFSQPLLTAVSTFFRMGVHAIPKTTCAAFGQCIGLTSAALQFHISVIIGSSARKQVTRIYARRIIAAVAHKAVRPFSGRKKIRYPMRPSYHMQAIREIPITIGIFASEPAPAVVGRSLLNVTPKALNALRGKVWRVSIYFNHRGLRLGQDARAANSLMRVSSPNYCNTETCLL